MKIKQTKSSKKSSKQTIFEHKRVGRTIFVNNANFSNFFSLHVLFFFLDVDVVVVDDDERRSKCRFNARILAVSDN